MSRKTSGRCLRSAGRSTGGSADGCSDFAGRGGSPNLGTLCPGGHAPHPELLARHLAHGTRPNAAPRALSFDVRGIVACERDTRWGYGSTANVLGGAVSYTLTSSFFRRGSD